MVEGIIVLDNIEFSFLQIISTPMREQRNSCIF